jgi:WD40 repeat protein
MLSHDHGTVVSTDHTGGGFWVSDPLTRELRGIVVGHGEGARIGSLAVDPAGRRAHSAATDGTVRVWDLAEGRCLHVLTGHDGEVTALAPAPDGRFTSSGGEDGTVRVWDLETGRCLRVLEGHRGRVELLAASADARTLLSVGADGTMRAWRLEWDYDLPAPSA